MNNLLPKAVTDLRIDQGLDRFKLRAEDKLKLLFILIDKRIEAANKTTS